VAERWLWIVAGLLGIAVLVGIIIVIKRFRKVPNFWRNFAVVTVFSALAIGGALQIHFNQTRLGILRPNITIEVVKDTSTSGRALSTVTSRGSAATGGGFDLYADQTHGLVAQGTWWQGSVAAAVDGLDDLDDGVELALITVANRLDSVILMLPLTQARRGRSSSGQTSSNRCRTCSAHSVAQRASRWWWSSSVNTPPLRMVMKRLSRTLGSIISCGLPYASPSGQSSQDGLFLAIYLHQFFLIQSTKYGRHERMALMQAVEGTIYEGPANHFMGIESVGGKLYLTAETLIFISHSINIQVHQMSIPLRDIVDVRAVNTLGVVPNGLHVDTIAGTTERFVVYKRKLWISEINRLRNS
jgi:hypothetical protein